MAIIISEMKSYSFRLTLLFAGAITMVPELHAQHPSKLRVIVTTDGEIDDQSSMVRFLM
jgi:hypothetical protein